jgi:hypothetical protein
MRAFKQSAATTSPTPAGRSRALGLAWLAAGLEDHLGLKSPFDPEDNLIGTVAARAPLTHQLGEVRFHPETHQTVAAFLEVALEELNLTPANLAVQQLIQLPD